MTYHARFLVTALCLLCLLTSPLPSRAQTPAKSNKSKKTSAKNELPPDDTADPMLSVRREMAASLLISLADEARAFRNVAVNVRTQGQVADALWETDQERARALFRRAWETAEAADAESLQQSQEKSDATSTRATPTNLRGDVLLLTQLRDPALAEEFLAKLDKERRGANDNATGPRPQVCPGPTEQPPAAYSQRMASATQVLATGEAERAMQLAAPALNCVTMQSLYFLTTLRAKNAKAADQAFASMLMNAESDPSSDANTVSLMSSYVLKPLLFITVGRRGNFNTSAPPDLPPAPDLAPALRAAFFRTAAQILMRPLPPPDQDRTSAGPAGTYFVIRRLLPVFEQHSPDTVVALNAFLSSMTSDVSEGFRSGRSEWLTKGLVPENRLGGDAEEALSRVGRVSNASERDAIYANAIFQIYKDDYPRALELLAKMSDTDLRQRIRAFIDFNAVIQASLREDAAELVRLAREGELTPLQRVIAFTEAAGVKKKRDTLRDGELLDEAQTWARRIDSNSTDRARALVATATRLFKVDRERAWAIIPEVVKAANAADGFTGRDTRITAEVRTTSNHSVSDHRVMSFHLSGIFKDLARADMNRAVEVARSFAGESPRAVSLVAIGRSVLEEKPKAQAKRQGQ